MYYGAAGLIALALAGCGGGGGGTTASTTTTGGTTGGTTALATVTPPSGTPIDASTISTTEFAALAPSGAVTGVTIASPPVVTFQLTDANGRGIKGLGFTSQSSTAARPGLSNLAFTVAKLVPGTNGAPSKWVNYIVTGNPTTTAAGTPGRPSTDNIGTLVDNGDGTYKYTFYRDITKVKDEIAAATAPAGSNLADLGDLTYDPTLVHRLVIQVGGNARGTGTNTATGADSGVTAVPMGTPKNIVFDWIPATGKVLTATDTGQREVVNIATCTECHNGGFTIHGGNRQDPRYCVMCHTDQRKYGRSNVASTNYAFPALTETKSVSGTTGITSYSYTPNTYVADGAVMGDFPNLIHKIHQGHSLVKQNYNYANVAFNNKGYSILDNGQRACAKCHDSTKAAQADNWNTAPSRLACGSCHDGINFADGKGKTLSGLTTGHAGINLAQTSDQACSICHKAADIKVYHQLENVTEHNPTIATGLATFTYEIQSAAVDATTNNTTVKFKISKDGTALTSLPPAGFTGSPSFLLAWANSQDGITTPVDFNNHTRSQAQAISVSISNLLANTGGSISGPDSSGYFTATLTGANQFPAGTKMRTVGLQGYYTQAAGTGGITTATARHALSVVKTVTGDSERRKVIDPAKCANCHEWFEGHGGNRVIGKDTVGNVNICVMCHVPGLATSGRGIADASLNTWVFDATSQKIVNDWKTRFGFDQTLANAALKFPVTSNNFKDLIHGIHAGRDRVSPFADARDRVSSGVIQLLDFARMDFPGKLKECTTCHVAGTFGSVPSGTLASTYESINAAYAAGIAAGTATPAQAKAAYATANSDDKVTSPYTAACVSCHDSAAAKGHMTTQNGLIDVPRSTFQTKVATSGGAEACGTCHGPGRAEDVAVKHR